MEEFIQHGFSVAVAAFLLARVERELRALRAAIETLRHCPTCTVSPWRVSLAGTGAGEPGEGVK